MPPCSPLLGTCRLPERHPQKGPSLVQGAALARRVAQALQAEVRTGGGHPGPNLLCLLGQRTDMGVLLLKGGGNTEGKMLVFKAKLRTNPRAWHDMPEIKGRRFHPSGHLEHAQTQGHDAPTLRAVILVAVSALRWVEGQPLKSCGKTWFSCPETVTLFRQAPQPVSAKRTVLLGSTMSVYDHHVAGT